MNIFERNIEFLKTEYPELVKVVEDNVEDDGYEQFVTKKQEPSLTLARGDKTYYLHSKYNAVEEARHWVASLGLELLKAEHVVIIGCGLGYYLEQLMQCTKVTNVYVYEPDIHIFNAWLYTRDVQKVLKDQRIRLFVVGDDRLLQTKFSMHISQYANKSMNIAVPPIYNKLFPSIIDNIQREVKKALYTYMVNQATLDTFQNEWLSNILYNLPYAMLSTPALELKERAKGIPAIIVGSGPSLQYDINHLKKLQSKCIIIAAGSSIQALQYNGIDPHMIVSVDGGLPNLKVFENVDTSRSVLLFCPQVNHNILERYKGPLIVAGMSVDSITPAFVESEVIPVFRSTSSVTGLALQVAMYMGASEIVLTGQDLSYPDKQFYSSGVRHITEEQVLEQIEAATELVANVDGGQNPTTVKMKVTLNDMELLIQLIQLTSSNDVRIINASRHGAVIEGTKWIAMDELSNIWKEIPKMDFDSKKLLKQLSDKEKLERMNKLKAEFISLLAQTKDCGMRIKELLANIHATSDELVDSNINTLTKRLREIDELWSTITNQQVFKMVYSFSLQHHINNYMKYVAEIVETENVWSKLTLIVRHLGRLVELMDDFTPELIEILSKSMECLESILNRLGETNYEQSI